MSFTELNSIIGVLYGTPLVSYVTLDKYSFHSSNVHVVNPFSLNPLLHKYSRYSFSDWNSDGIDVWGIIGADSG